MAEEKNLIIEVDIDAASPLKIEVGERGGSNYLDIRFYWEPNPGEWARTKRGVRVGLDDTLPLVNTILDALNQTIGSSFVVVEGEKEVDSG